MWEWEAEFNPDFQREGVSGTRSRDSDLERERHRPELEKNDGWLLPGLGLRGLRATLPKLLLLSWASNQWAYCNLLCLFWKVRQENSLREERLPWHSTEGRSNGIVH